MSDLPTRLQQARITLLMDFPFFGQLALRLSQRIDSSVDTAATDGKEIVFNPDFCAKLSDKQLAWLYAHEVSHPALGHIWRIGSRDPDKANIAADYVVNEMLENIITSQPGTRNRMERIPSAYLDRQYYGLSMEQVYQLLPDSAGSGKGNGQGQSTIGTFSKPVAGTSSPDPSGDQSTPQPDTLEQEWKAAAAQAATMARSRNRGHLPAAIEELLKELFEPAVPWQDILRQFVSRICRDDYSFRRPNRRFAHQGVMLPTLRSESLGRIVVAVDTSGSIKCDSNLLKTFLSELQGILDTTRPECMHLLDCDARVHTHTEFRAGDDLRGTVFRGGGGTCFRPVFNFTAEYDLRPDCLVYFTDLEGSFPSSEPPYPTLWLNYGSPRLKAPFGQTIHIPKA